MALSYDEIRRIHRLEKNSSRLVEVTQEFYNDLHDFVSQEKETYLKSVKNFSSATSRDFLNLKKMVEEIFSMREKKVLNYALAASRTKEMNEDNMAVQEKKLFKGLVLLLESHDSILEGIFNGSGKASDGSDLNNISVEIVSDIPEFVGTDMKEYGPFKKGSVVMLPGKIAKLLSSRKLAEVK